MSEVTVTELASVVGTPVERLLGQMKEAGLPHDSVDQAVSDSDKKTLKDILQQPGAAMYIVSAIVDEYQPEFNITVKKSNSEQKTSEKTE